jgi:hypothetical protein
MIGDLSDEEKMMMKLAGWTETSWETKNEQLFEWVMKDGFDGATIYYTMSDWAMVYDSRPNESVMCSENILELVEFHAGVIDAYSR